MKRVLTAADDSWAPVDPEDAIVRLKQHCEDAGYTFDTAWWDGEILRFHITSNNKYTPEIYVRNNKNSSSIVISTEIPTYGSPLDLSEYREFVSQINATSNLVNYLNNFNWESLRKE